MNQIYKGKTNWQKRYCDAHFKWYLDKYPNIIRDELYCLPKFPAVTTANGLTSFVVNYLDWTGCHGNRINTVGRIIKGKTTVTPIGIIKGKDVMIKGSTKRGTADVQAIIGGSRTHLGISCHIEIKIGKDTQSDNQKKQERAVSSAGGLYVIVKTVDDFFIFYDKVIAMPKISKLF